MELKAQALEFLQKDILLHVDMLECIRRNRAEIVYAVCENSQEDGVLLYDRPSGIYMLSAPQTVGAGMALSRLLPKEIAQKSGWVVTHGDNARQAVYAALNVVHETPVWQIAYLSKQPFVVNSSLQFAFAEREQIEWIKENYDKESPENIEKLAAEKKIYCAFADGKFVGFIGEHPEGSIGLLYIFPEHRRKGYAEALECLIGNEYIKQGRIPYGHVVIGNEASRALQEKLGFETASQKVYWLKES